MLCFIIPIDLSVIQYNRCSVYYYYYKVDRLAKIAKTECIRFPLSGMRTLRRHIGTASTRTEPLSTDTNEPSYLGGDTSSAAFLLLQHLDRRRTTVYCIFSSGYQ